VSNDGVNFTTVVNLTGNIDSITTHDIAPTTARFVRLNIVTPTQTTDTSARIYEFQVFPSQAGSSADFAVAVTPPSQNVVAGGLPASFTTVTIALGGFNGNVAWSATGLPSGAAATFSPTTVNGSGSSTVSISTSSSTPPGTYTVTITGTSGRLQH
jgi:hypothetical protein